MPSRHHKLRPIASIAMLALLCAVCLATYPATASWDQGSGAYRAAVLASNGAAASTNSSYNSTAQVEAPAYLGLDVTTWNFSVEYSVVTANQDDHCNTSKWNVSYSINDGTTTGYSNRTNDTFDWDGDTVYVTFTTSSFTTNSSAVLTITLYENGTQRDTWTDTVDIQNTTLGGLLDYWVPVLIEVTIVMAVVGCVVEVGKKLTGR